MKKQNSFSIIIPVGMNPRPKIHEETAAEILAEHFKYDVHFIYATNRGAPDISIGGKSWEIKSPIGSGANNIQKNVREAASQSNNVVIDLRRSKQKESRALGHIKLFSQSYSKLKNVLVITKQGRVIVIKPQL